MSTDYEHEDRNREDLTISDSLEPNEAVVYTRDEHVYVPKDEAPKAAAALLRAAGWGEPAAPLPAEQDAIANSVNGALAYLDAAMAKQDADAAKEADKVTLREEARKLYEASRARMAKQGVTVPTWGNAGAENVEHWEHIARAARGLHRG